MNGLLRQLDELLRGDRTRIEDLRSGDLRAPTTRFLPIAITLGALYGLAMGLYAATGEHPDAWKQLFASAVKLPGLFLLTLAVTLPSLYVFNALVGVRLNPRNMMRLLVAAMVVNLAVGASLAPILAFFTLSTESYHFMVLLNVVLLTIAGIIGLRFLVRTLRALAVAATTDSSLPDEQRLGVLAAEGDRDAAVELGRVRLESQQRLGAAKIVFRTWVLIYAVVGAQMGWILRPFIGSPGAPFEFFRQRQSNFFASVFESLRTLLGG